MHCYYCITQQVYVFTLSVFPAENNTGKLCHSGYQWHVSLDVTGTSSRVGRGVAGLRGITGIFFWGGNVIFPDFFPGMKCFFPVENSHFGRPKTNSIVFKSEKPKKRKRKRKKGPHRFLELFLLPFPPLFPFFLASFFPIRQQKFPGQKSLGGTLPLPVTPLAGLCTLWQFKAKQRSRQHSASQCQVHYMKSL